MKTSGLKHGLAVALAAAGLFLQVGASICTAQTPPGLPPGVQDVLKLVQNGLDEDVVLAHIRNAAAMYNLSADQIIYLKNQGVTPNEIKALLVSVGSVAPAVVQPTPITVPTPTHPVYVTPPPVAITPAPGAGQPVSLAGFQAELAPYGTWLDIPGYGQCWRPAEAARDPFWRPYCDGGHWVYTAEGWFWQSDYIWGDVVFHYGRWHRGQRGWVWVPGYDWAPAWVSWRHVEGFCGWAPLPPSAVFRAGVGLWFNGRVALDVDFGLGADMFVFVPYDHFWDRSLRSFLLPRERVSLVFGRSVVLNGYRFEHGRFMVEGLGRERLGSLTRHEIRVEEPVFHGHFRGREEVERKVIREDRRDERRDERIERR